MRLGWPVVPMTWIETVVLALFAVSQPWEKSLTHGRADVYVSVPGMHGRMLSEDFDVYADLIHFDDS